MFLFARNRRVAKSKPRDLTEGSILRALIAIAAPTVLANILQTAYQLTDTYWVGRLGTEEVAAVSLSFPIIFLLISLGAGLGIAGTILVAQHKGRRNQQQIDHVASQTYLMMSISAAVLSIIGYVAAPFIIQLMGAEAAVADMAVSYLRISFIGLIFLFAYFVFQSLMRGVGDATTPLYIVLGTVLLNFVLDPLFIHGFGPIPAMGVSGAAWATIGTQGLAALIGTLMLASGKYDIHVRFRAIRPDTELIKRMFKLGLPSSLEQSTRALGLTIMTFLVASISTDIIASYGIGTRVFSFVIIPALALSIACSTLVGQNIGARKLRRAEQSVYLAAAIGFSVLTVVGILVFIFAKQLAGFFVPGQTEIINESAKFIRIMALTFGFVGIQQSLIGAFRGSGNTISAMVMAIVTLWVLQFPTAYILTNHTSLGASGIWWSFPISNVAAAIVSFMWFRTGSWKRKQLIEDDHADEAYEEILTQEGLST